MESMEMETDCSMKLIADTHTHTVACNHAYSTIMENCAEAARKGLSFLAVTEHAPALEGSPDEMFFRNLRAIPNAVNGVILLKGAEVNVKNSRGEIDLREKVLRRLDWVIASMHVPVFEPGSRKDHTSAWLAVAENPHVDVIGHPGDERFAFDEQTVIRAFAKYGKIVEINAHSFNVRPGAEINCPRIARLCAEEGVRVVVDSDAHSPFMVGEQEAAVQMLEDIGFPEELIINGDYERFLQVAREKAEEDMAEYLETVLPVKS